MVPVSVSGAIVGVLVALFGAAPESPLQVTAPTCPAIDPAEVQRLVVLELVAVTQEIREGPPLRVELGCARSNVLTIAVTDPLTSKTLERTIPAPADEPGQERVVALAIAQLFAASWLELLLPEAAREQDDPPVVLADPGTPNAAVRAATDFAAAQATPPFSPRAELATGVGVRGRSIEALPFPALHVDAEVRGWLSPSVGLIGRIGFDYGNANRDAGQVRGLAVMAGGGLGWRWRPREFVGMGGSATLSGGWARVAGRPGRGDVSGAVNQGGTGEVAVAIGPRVFARRFRLDVDAEAGGMLRTPEGLVEDAPSVTMGGIWVGAVLRLGVDISPPP
jgi:hypothetical protein